jgi:cellulose synthase/poly-beta-1,6-N-acetylglucosamine synthase-like glycosyltransferase
MSWVFWCSLGFIAYTFVGYPGLLWLLGWRCSRLPRRASIWPKVSLIIAAHNAGRIIGAKLENTLSLDYPRDKLEIVVASDGSDDDTSAVVRTFADRQVRLLEIVPRRGKHHAQMAARDAACGAILVFTDASVLLEPGSLRSMVANFADRSVGVVSSEDQIQPRPNPGPGEGSYVRGEMGLRRLESRVASAVSASGSFFGARQEVCEDWHPDSSSDFFVPLHAVERGFRVVVDPECRARFAVVKSGRAEFHRKVRTIVHGLDVFFSHLALLNPFHHGFFSWQLASHKLFRWLLPYALAVLLVSNILLWRNHPFYQLFLLLQLCGYAAGVVALALEQWLDFEPLRLAAFFLMGNAATVVAWVKFSLGERYVVWEPSQRS